MKGYKICVRPCYFERVQNLRPTGRRNPAKINSYFVVKIAFEILPSLPFCWTAGILNINKLDKKSFQKLLICQGRKKKRDHFKCKSPSIYQLPLYLLLFKAIFMTNITHLTPIKFLILMLRSQFSTFEFSRHQSSCRSWKGL